MRKTDRRRPPRVEATAPGPAVLPIRAGDGPASLTIEATAPVEILAASGEGKRPTFDILAYSGAPFRQPWSNNPVIADLDGLKAAGARIPVLLDHDQTRIVGQGTAAIDGGGARVTGTITGDDADAMKVVVHARNGFQWQASIGATVVRQEFLKAGERAVVNGREVQGPVLIARESRLHEVSFVAIGADSQTSASVAASNPPGPRKGTTMNFDQWLSAKGFDPAAITDAQRTYLRAQFDAEQAPPPGAGTGTAVAAAGGSGAGAAQAYQQVAAPAPAQTQTLDQIVAARRAEDHRVAEITRITAEAINDRPALVDEYEQMARAAIEARSPVQEFELHVLRASRARGPGGSFGVRPGDRKAGARMIEAALCLAGGLERPEKQFDEQTLNAASDRFKDGLGLRDVLVLAARENGYTGPTSSDIRGLMEHAFGANIRAGGFSTLSLPGILGNVANRFLKAGFDAVESTWREIAAVRSVRDFRAIDSYSLTGDMKYQKVGPTGEIKHATLGEVAYTNQAETYARMFAVTRRDIINDDIGALTQVPRRLGRGAALALNEVFWRAFMDNAAFFTTARLNLFAGAGTALGIAGLTTGETAFLNQVDPDGNPLAVTPKILLVPNGLSVQADSLMSSTELRGTDASYMTTNPHAGKYRVVRSSYLSNPAYTGNSATAWYLLADPSDLPVIEVAFLNGRQEPTVESADADFNTLGIQFRGFHDFGTAKQEYRGGVRMAGA